MARLTLILMATVLLAGCQSTFRAGVVEGTQPVLVDDVTVSELAVSTYKLQGVEFHSAWGDVVRDAVSWTGGFMGGTFGGMVEGLAKTVKAFFSPFDNFGGGE